MSSRAEAYDCMAFRRFTGRAELDKVLNSLSGILSGIVLDGEITQEEFQELTHWCNLHREYSDVHPFSELLPILDSSLADGVLTDEEIQDMLWFITKLQHSNEFYNITASSLQVLHGLLHGLLADGAITDEELNKLRMWLDAYDFLKGVYPYDEIDSLLMSIMADGIITEDERAMAKAFFGEFIDTKSSLNVSEPELAQLKATYSIQGICAACPEIAFPGAVFCLTGASARAQRKDIMSLLELVGARYIDNVSKKTQYLIVGGDGNPCWVFSCYGRKVEAAVGLRKSGHPITILHENDFWDELISYAESNGIDYTKYSSR